MVVYKGPVRVQKVLQAAEGCGLRESAIRHRLRKVAWIKYKLKRVSSQTCVCLEKKKKVSLLLSDYLVKVKAEV